MKLVASSKLHKAEADIEAVRPYERTLEEILSVVESYRSDEEGYIKASDACVQLQRRPQGAGHLCGVRFGEGHTRGAQDGRGYQEDRP